MSSGVLTPAAASIALAFSGSYGVVGDLVVIRPHRRRDQRLGLHAGAEIDVLDDRVAIDRHRQRLPHFLLVERRLGVVERPIGDVEARRVNDLQRRVLLHFRNVGRPRIAVDVAFARLQLGVARGRVGGDGEDEIVDQRLLAEIVGVLLVADHRILLVGDEGERAGADRRLVELLRRSLLQQEVGVFGRADRHEVHREIGEDGDVRLLQLHDDGVVVGLGRPSRAGSACPCR